MGLCILIAAIAWVLACIGTYWAFARKAPISTDDDSTYGQFDPAGKDGKGSDIRFRER